MAEETPITREQATANLVEAEKILASKIAAKETALTEYAAGRKSQAIDDLGLLELGGKVADASKLVAKAESAVSAAKHAVDVFVFQERAADRNRLIAKASKTFRDVVKQFGMVAKLVLVVKADDDVAAKLQSVNERIAELNVEQATLAACLDMAWGELGELASDAIRFSVTPAPEGSSDGPTVSVVAVAKGERTSTPRSAGSSASRQRRTFGTEQLGARAYAEKYATAEALAGFNDSLSRGKPVNWTHLADATAKRLGHPVNIVS